MRISRLLPLFDDSGSMHRNSAEVQTEFPMLAGNPQEIFLDPAASVQKPDSASYVNIHRRVYDLSEAASQCYERARAKAGKFIGGASRGVVFTKNSTEAANLLAHGLAERLHPGDGVLCSTLEHCSNLLPWREVAQRRGSFVRSIPVSPDGVLLLEDLDALFEDIKVFAITGMSNVTGEISNLAPLVKAAHAVGALVVVDGAQLVSHHPVNVAALDVDALFSSGHKLGAPTGIAVLWAKPELLDEMPPFHLGGGMVETVTDTGFTPAPVVRHHGRHRRSRGRPGEGLELRTRAVKGGSCRPISAIRLYDSARREVVPFVPAGTSVKMYTCGNTPDDSAHVGHGATASVYDVLRRTLHAQGFDTVLVRNITDLDDDIIAGSARQGLDPRKRNPLDSTLWQRQTIYLRLECSAADSEAITGVLSSTMEHHSNFLPWLEGVQIWDARSQTPGSVTCMQGDGNVVLVGPGNRPGEIVDLAGRARCGRPRRRRDRAGFRCSRRGPSRVGRCCQNKSTFVLMTCTGPHRTVDSQSLQSDNLVPVHH